MSVNTDPPGSIEKKGSIESSNDMVPNRQQDITWTKGN